MSKAYSQSKKIDSSLGSNSLALWFYVIMFRRKYYILG